MKISLLKNGWTIWIEQFDVRTVSIEAIQQIRSLITTNLTVIIKGQHGLTMDEFRTFVRLIGVPERKKDWFPDRFLISPEERDVLRVTGAKNENGEFIGVFNTPDDLSWHCNSPGQNPRPDVLCLYAVEGTVGSITSMSNTSLTYKDLMEDNLSTLSRMNMEAPLDHYRELRDLLPRLSCRYDFFISLDGSSKQSDYNGEVGDYPILHMNKANIAGLMFSPNQAKTLLLDGKELEREKVLKLARALRSIVTAEKYVYHHRWEDGRSSARCADNSSSRSGLLGRR